MDTTIEQLAKGPEANMSETTFSPSQPMPSAPEPAAFKTPPATTSAPASAPVSGTASAMAAPLIPFVYGSLENDGAPTAVTKERSAIVGTTFIRNIWYFALTSDKLKPGQTVSKQMLCEPVLIGRDRNGKAFAIRDICPHQGVPLSEGSFDGCELQCPFHGWRFDTSGVCTDIPALVEGQRMNICAVKTKSFPCTEVQGCIWVYFGEPGDELPEVPRAPLLDKGIFGQTCTTLIVPSHFDYHAVALLDPSHVPYVHKQWWWSRSGKSIKDKTKTYVPVGTGWTMVKHKRPKQSFLLRFLGTDIETEIGFRLPAYRMEHIISGGRALLSGITTLTPIDENTTEFNHITYWMAPFVKLWEPIARPFIDYSVKGFVTQDQGIAIKQAKGLRFKPHLIMTIKDSGTPGRWYFQLKKEWADAYEQGRKFVNPLKETVLHWRT